MKVSVELDLTPQEARQLLGLPDVEAMQERIMKELETKTLDAMKSITDPEILLKSIIPSQAGSGMSSIQKVVSGIAKSALSKAVTPAKEPAKPRTTTRKRTAKKSS